MLTSITLGGWKERRKGKEGGKEDKQNVTHFRLINSNIQCIVDCRQVTCRSTLSLVVLKYMCWICPRKHLLILLHGEHQYIHMSLTGQLQGRV